MSAPSSSPPPYSLTPPDVPLPVPPAVPALTSPAARRAASSPHLHLHLPPPPAHPPPLGSHARHAVLVARRPHPNPTSDEDESGAETDEGVVFRPHTSASSTGLSFADSLRLRILGKGKARAFDEGWSRPISTTPGAPCAGETETEGEDSPRNLPTARITRSSLSQELKLPASTAWLVPILFQLFRLLAVVPALFGTLWNLYHVCRPPDGLVEWRVDYAVSVFWTLWSASSFFTCPAVLPANRDTPQSLLTGWQCLQLTSGLLKRWRVYYSPFATLIRLLALQAICWPATHLTLTLLDHARRPLVCWAAIGTTTCCSRAIQLWVTSNIVPAARHASHHPPPSGAHAHPAPPSHEGERAEADRERERERGRERERERERSAGEDGEEHLRRARRRRWDWELVRRECMLPAGAVYAVMAWAVVLRRDVLGC